MFLGEKEQRNMWKKSKENLQKRRFPAYFRHFRPGKNFSRKFFSFFKQKNQRKLMMKSREDAKKQVFPAYFRHFQPEKYVFQKSGSVTFLTLPFCISVQNFMKKYKVQLEKFKKYVGCSDNF